MVWNKCYNKNINDNIILLLHLFHPFRQLHWHFPRRGQLTAFAVFVRLSSGVTLTKIVKTKHKTPPPGELSAGGWLRGWHKCFNRNISICFFLSLLLFHPFRQLCWHFPRRGQLTALAVIVNCHSGVLKLNKVTFKRTADRLMTVRILYISAFPPPQTVNWLIYSMIFTAPIRRRWKIIFLPNGQTLWKILIKEWTKWVKLWNS